MSEPGVFALLMNSVPVAQRAGISALNMIVIFAAQAAAASLSGVLISRFGYPPVLIAASLICAAAALLFRGLARRNVLLHQSRDSVRDTARPCNAVPTRDARVAATSRSFCRIRFQHLLQCRREFSAARKPVLRSSITSGIPPTGNATTGTPAENASSKTRGIPSCFDGITRTSRSRITPATSSCQSKNSTGSPAGEPQDLMVIIAIPKQRRAADHESARAPLAKEPQPRAEIPPALFRATMRPMIPIAQRFSKLRSTNPRSAVPFGIT